MHNKVSSRSTFRYKSKSTVLFLIYTTTCTKLAKVWSRFIHDLVHVVVHLHVPWMAIKAKTDFIIHVSATIGLRREMQATASFSHTPTTSVDFTSTRAHITRCHVSKDSNYH